MAWLAAVVLCLLGPPAFGQSATATLQVSVRDESGSVIPGAEIRITNRTTRLEREGTTGALGILVIPLVPPGSYDLSASVPGFRTEVIEAIRLEVGIKSALEVLLRPGSPSNSVVVRADLATLRPVDSVSGEVLNNSTLMSMPLNGRQFLELALLGAGTAPPAPGSELSTQASSGINVNGARESSNNFLLDGVDNNDLFINRFVISPSLDAIQEFSILSNNYDVEYGRSGGGQVNVILKSGSRQWQGSAYEFFRHSGMDARNFFASSTPFLRQSQFGATLGGPLARQGHFFFANLEALRTRRGDPRLGSVPSPAEKAGDFSQSGTPILDPFTGQPFPGNRIPADRLHPVGLKVAALFPDPNLDLPGRTFQAAPVGTVGSTQFMVKTDHLLSDQASLFLRYSFSNDSRKFPFSPGVSGIPGFGTSVLDRGQNVALGWTQVFTPLTLNEFRFGFNRLRREVLTENADSDPFENLGIQGPSLAGPDRGFPAFVIAGYQQLGDDPNLPTLRRTGTFHLSDVLSLQRGRHHLKAGGEIRHYRENGFTRLFPRGQIIFTGVFTNDALADLLLGFPTLSLLGSSNHSEQLRTWAFNGFVGDDWKLHPRFTLNLGVRYEFNTPPEDADDWLTVFDPASAALLPVGAGGIPEAGIESDRNNLAPRVGLAWDPLGAGWLVVRAGYGIFYDSGTLVENSALYFNPPEFQLNLYFTGLDPLLVNDPFPADRAVGSAPSPFTLDRNMRMAYLQHWNLGLQAAVGSNLTLEARYVGSKGTKLVSKRNLNQPAPGEGFLDARRPVPGFGDILYVESAGSSLYHSLQLRAQRRFSSDLGLLVSYTFARSIDNASAFLETEGYNNTPQNSWNIAAERGPSNFDLRHRLAGSLVYSLPALGEVSFFRGWQLSSIVTLQSGRPVTPRLEVDNSNTGNVGGVFGSDRPNLVGNPKLSQPGPDQYFNPGAFEVPAPYSFGNSGRNIVFGPGLAVLDLSLSKSFPIQGDRRVEFRAEAFNLFNRVNLGLPDSFVGRPTFGRVLYALPAREIQLALRLVF